MARKPIKATEIDFDEVEESAPHRDPKRKALAKVAATFSAWKPAREVMTAVRAVPTIFPQYDRATRVGGHPIQRVTLVHGQSNHGKALANETPILGPDGWKPIGDLEVGDRVIGGNGQSAQVTGVFPQGLVQLFRVTFSDGESLECCNDHLWFTTTPRERMKGRFVRQGCEKIPTGVEGKGSVKSLAQIRESFTPGRHAIPLVAPIDFGVVGELPLHPYLLGLLLGDGSFRGSTVKFDKPEEDIQSRLVALLPDGDRVTRDEMTACIVGAGGTRGKGQMSPLPSRTAVAMHRLGLKGKLSWQKFIPDEYIMADAESRLELLRGLLDTDGYVTAEGASVEFSSSSPKLAEGVAFLTRSLGGIATIAWRTPRYTYRGESKEGKRNARILVRFPASSGIVPVSSRKHLAKWRGSERRQEHRTIVSIEPSRVGEATCIRVDSPNRTFVADCFIVTHNTAWCHGLGLSFLQRDHFYADVDAEMTNPHEWLRSLMHEHADNPAFVAIRPDTYEQTVDAVRDLVTKLHKAVLAKTLGADTSALIVVDSLRKLVPEDFWAKVHKHGAQGDKGSVDGMSGRGAQIKAKMNADWLDELTPLLNRTNTAMVLIARESEDTEASANDRKYGKAYKVTGGKAIFFDSSLVVRVERASYIYDPPSGGPESRVLGERHKLVISKTKVAGKDDKNIVCFFHTSNGNLIPEGFDRARDVLELAKEYGITDVAGQWIKWRGQKWQGIHKAVKSLTLKPEALAALESDVRARFSTTEKLPVDTDGD